MAEEPSSTAADRPAPLIVDLILGAWRPREAASQLGVALGIELVPLHEDDPDRAVMSNGAQAVDAGANGDPLVMTAFDDAGRVAEAPGAGAGVTVLVPRFGEPLRAENEWFLLFLARQGIAVTLAGGDPAYAAIVDPPFARDAALPSAETDASPTGLSADQMRLLRFFPGLLPRRLAEHFAIEPTAAGLIAVGPDHFRIPPALRDKDPRTAARDFDAMAAIETLDDGLLALCQSHVTAHFADCAVLAGHARRAFLKGSPDLALALSGRALLAARRPEDAADAALCREEIRVFEGRFADMAAARDPSSRLPDPARQQLLRMKRLGSLAGGDLAGAGALFAALRDRLGRGEVLAADDLQELLLAADGAAGAADVETMIGLGSDALASLTSGDGSDPRLVHALSIRLARLHRLRGDRERSRAAADQAFQSSLGARTFHEMFEMNMLRALAETDARSSTAQPAWLRAALLWLAIEPPEALSRSAAVALFGNGAWARAALDRDACRAISERLEAAWPDITAGPNEPCPAVRGLTGAGIAADNFFGGPGAAILWSSRTAAGPDPSAPRVRLIRLACSALRTLCPSVPLNSGTIWVDGNLGVDVPATRSEALSAALRAGVGEFVFGGEAIILDKAARQRLTGEIRVTVSPAVASVSDDGVVRFRRHLPDRKLTGDEGALLRAARDSPAMPLSAFSVLHGMMFGEAEPRLRRLEAARLIRLDFEAR